jgi:hypothetical protein
MQTSKPKQQMVEKRDMGETSPIVVLKTFLYGFQDDRYTFLLTFPETLVEQCCSSQNVYH